MAQTIPKLMQEMAEQHPQVAAQMSKDEQGTFVSRSFEELYREVSSFAAGLQKLKVKRGDHVGLISENRAEWFVSDLALLSLGAADVPRGNDSMAQELAYILGFSECSLVIVENKEQLKKVYSVKDQIPSLKHFLVLDPNFDSSNSIDTGRIKVSTYAEVRDAGLNVLAKHPELIKKEIEQGKADDTCTIIFTSGTTGEPKGVVLSHRNFLHQVSCIPSVLDITPGDIWICVLPVWHSFERIVQYIALGSASTLAYSKPIGQIMLADMAVIRPQWMASVPRIWEAVRAGIYRKIKQEGGIKLLMFNFFVAVGGSHKRMADILFGRAPQFKPRSRVLDLSLNLLPYLLLSPLKLLGNALVFKKIKTKLGGRFIAGVSGGGALPPAVDSFFGSAGILLLEGYGLTETAPVLAVRSQFNPVPGTVGPMLAETECRIIGEEGEPLPAGSMGLITVRGPQVMNGYYRKPELTAKVLSEDGWLNTGDLGKLTLRGELKITGRAKDTIVLLGGENIEPLPIEQKITESEYIDTAVVVGQDQKYLAALIIPNTDAVERFADENHIPYNQPSDLLDSDDVRELMDGEINSLVNGRTGFRVFERVYRFAILKAPFEIGEELSAKQEIKRHVIADKYSDEIASL
ncbi:MAG: long-chain fatty acid--CoA ligase, partial [Spirochaetia bacterium]|nr:long-chain fatty acid--CoA ligase [Spirochaetia bacterium]